MPEPQHRLHRGGPVDQDDLAGVPQRDGQRAAGRTGLTGGASEGDLAQLLQVEPVQVAGHQQDARSLQPARVELVHVGHGDRGRRVGVAVQGAPVPLGESEQVGPQRRVGPRTGLGPLHPQSAHLVVADPEDVGVVQLGRAGGLGQQPYGGGQQVDRHGHAGAERVPVHRRRQLGAQTLQGQRERGRVAGGGALLERFGQHARGPLAALGLVRGAGVEQQRGAGDQLTRHVRGHHLTAGHGDADNLRKRVRPGLARLGTGGDQGHDGSPGT